MSDLDFTVRSLFREYPVSFVDDAAPLLASETGTAVQIIIDTAVIRLHAGRVRGLLEPARTISIEATEENKTLDGCRRVIETLVERGFRRDGALVAIGGGIIQDITAFAASILYRGVDWMFVPTTLLAQADSCIGSKTSINLGDKKNLIGNFYPPRRIFIDTAFLDTLSLDDVKSGIGEMLHFYYYADSPIIERLMADYDRLLTDRALLRPYISESLRIKRAVAETDEFDRGERNKFNYGHTFGHALESATHYGIRHGLAVTVGMDLANYLSVQLGRMGFEQFNRMHAVLRRNMPDFDLAAIDLERYVAALSKDKKNLGSDLVCILASAPGNLEKVRIALSGDIRRVIADYYQGRVWASQALMAGAV
jgi:3-dehydroquinate synthase